MKNPRHLTVAGFLEPDYLSITAAQVLLIVQVRAQRAEVLRAALSYPLGKGHALILEGRALRNRENISIFQYDNRQLQLSWLWQLP